MAERPREQEVLLEEAAVMELTETVTEKMDGRLLFAADKPLPPPAPTTTTPTPAPPITPFCCCVFTPVS